MNREETRAAIFAARNERRPVPLEVSEWGVTVYVKYLTVEDQIALAEDNKPTELPVAVIVASLTDEAGERIFEDGDVAELKQEAFSVILKVFSFAARLNGLSTAELDEAMANFGVPPSGAPLSNGDSRSGSQTSEAAQAGS